MDMNVGKLWEVVRDGEAWHAAVHGVSTSLTRLSDWTKTTVFFFVLFFEKPQFYWHPATATQLQIIQGGGVVESLQPTYNPPT